MKADFEAFTKESGKVLFVTSDSERQVKVGMEIVRHGVAVIEIVRHDEIDKFSVRRENCHSIHIRLMKADFEAFTKESGKVQGDACCPL